VNKCKDDCSVSKDEYIPLEAGEHGGPYEAGSRRTDRKRLAGEVEPGPGRHQRPDRVAEWVTGSSSSPDWRSSDRLIRIPVYDPNDVLAHGRTDMKVAGFADSGWRGTTPNRERSSATTFRHGTGIQQPGSFHRPGAESPASGGVGEP